MELLAKIVNGFQQFAISKALLYKLDRVLNTSVIRQKGKSQNGVTRTQNTVNFPKNEHFLPPDTHMHLCLSRGKKYSFCFSENLTCFALLPTINQQIWCSLNKRNIVVWQKSEHQTNLYGKLGLVSSIPGCLPACKKST